MLRTQLSEDPRREPHEKETALHLEGDGSQFSVTSFKRVVYAKLLQRDEFSVKRLHVIDDDGQDHAVNSLDEAAERSLTIIGVTGQLPVGAVNIGTSRNSNSHADLVK
ncbi:hypothetical protein [Halobaculum roseum]|uniref:Uncharacterized protein n=1 Tax=Halobaculum roseum TaxID=2175149 RepID=A0ABD5MJU5_9EURY|nr:hypothetical protein [Halobaculum roseum]QZY03361.1 hypothetical protein K6T36_04110 [Halobaculum roseum]